MNAIARLAQQQQRLLGTVLAGTDDIQWILPAGQASGALARRGLQAYQSHGLALAERALSAAYPVIQQLIGADNFGPLARYFWRQQPPDAGDMARWGYGLADFLQTAASLADEPFLCDVARVEWALHRAASAADAQLDAPSFALLAAEPPAAPTLSLSPGVWLLVSAYPVVSLIEAHKLPLVQQAPALVRAAEQSQHGTGERALVWRQGFKPRVRRTSAVEHCLLESLLAGQSIETALMHSAEHQVSANADPEHTGAAVFDFSAWLAQAVQSGLVTGAHLIHQHDGASP